MAAWSRRPIASRPRLAASRRRPRRHRRQLASTLTAPASARPCRQYCSRRLRRIYKAVRFLHGRGRYQKKKLEPEAVKDVR